METCVEKECIDFVIARLFYLLGMFLISYTYLHMIYLKLGFASLVATIARVMGLVNIVRIVHC